MNENGEIEITKDKIENPASTISHGHSHNCVSCECGEKEETGYKAFIAPAISFALLLSGLIINHFHDSLLTSTWWSDPLWYLIAFIPVGFPVIRQAIIGISKGDYFNELTLMSIACIGAFLIGEYSEAVGVMLFYSLGETLQDRAVDKATRDISSLLDVRAETARVLVGGIFVQRKPEEVRVGDIIEVHPGERVPLDGVLDSQEGIFDTAALTGESVPRTIEKGGEVLAGMIASSTTVRLTVNRPYGESTLSRILNLVKNAQERKAKSEVFIRKFARIYTPIVTALAVLVVLIPAIIGWVSPSFHYVFSEWLYRSLVFLVISCPCALVISVPLSYFAGIGAASKMGILFKGGNYLETITHINAVAFDKTGTLTSGEFSVDKVSALDMPQDKLLAFMAASEKQSSHPLAKALVKYVESLNITVPIVDNMKELAGKGTQAIIEGQRVMTGNLKLMRESGIDYPEELNSHTSTIVACAINGVFSGYVILSDTVKSDSAETVKELKKLKVENILMLSGDRKEIVEKYAGMLDITEAHGELLPQDKAYIVESISKTPGKKIAFVGDGMNDAPVLALSNIGIAMGGLGSDAAIESADVVIQTDRPSRVATAIKIGRFTHKIVIQNITGAIIIKVVILALGLTGLATLWAAVFADVGVTMLAVLNSMRIMWKNFDK